MNTVIGLFPQDRDIDHENHLLQDAGFPRRNIQILTEVRQIFKTLGCDPNRIVTRSALWGAILAGAVYGLAALIVGWCECNLFGLPQLIAFETILAGLFVGAFIGGMIGVFVGAANYEEDTHFYTQGIREGDKVIVIQTDENRLESAKCILAREGSHGIKVLRDLPQQN